MDRKLALQHSTPTYECTYMIPIAIATTFTKAQPTYIHTLICISKSISCYIPKVTVPNYVDLYKLHEMNAMPQINLTQVLLNFSRSTTHHSPIQQEKDTSKYAQILLFICRQMCKTNDTTRYISPKSEQNHKVKIIFKSRKQQRFIMSCQN